MFFIDFTADDMRYADMTKEQILAQGKMNKRGAAADRPGRDGADQR